MVNLIILKTYSTPCVLTSLSLGKLAENLAKQSYAGLGKT